MIRNAAEETQSVGALRPDGTLTTYGRQALGQEPITPVKPPQTHEQVAEGLKQAPWWSSFSGVDETESGGIKMYVENFIPEGVTIISSLPKEGKTWMALSICKALTSGRPLFGRAGFEVPEPVPVIYWLRKSVIEHSGSVSRNSGSPMIRPCFCAAPYQRRINLEDTNLEQTSGHYNRLSS